MNLTVHYASQDWHFELVSIGGEQSSTKTVGDSVFASNLVVALKSNIPNMTDLYILLVSLTKDAWHGFIPVNPEHLKQGYHPTLKGWHVQKSDDGTKYICTIQYKIIMPNHQIEYRIQE